MLYYVKVGSAGPQKSQCGRRLLFTYYGSGVLEGASESSVQARTWAGLGRDNEGEVRSGGYSLRG